MQIEETTPIVTTESVPTQSFWSQALYVLRRWPVIPIIILVTLVLSAVFAPLIAPADPTFTNLRERNAPPVWMDGGSSKHLLGADPIGRDQLSRIIYGARVSLLVVGVSIGLGLAVGVIFGLIAGYYGGWLDELIMRLADTSRAVPFILIALVAAIVFGQRLSVILIILAFATWPVFARQVRAEVLVLRGMDYVSVSRVLGAPTHRIMRRHILPGLLNTIVVIATLQVGSLILTEAILSFLGAGIPPPTAAWGVMIADGQEYLTNAWWVSFFPGVAIVLTVMAFNFMGDWLRDYFDPKLRQL